MVNRARLSPPQTLALDEWSYHKAEWASMPAQLLMQGDRRMEAENYLSGGYGIRLAIEAQPVGWVRLSDLANVWQPSRLKGIQVGPEFGTPFLAATQVFDLRPTPRKWLAIERTHSANERFVEHGTILVTCSGSVGKAIPAFAPHQNTLITHDLLRVEPRVKISYGWLYAYLRSPQARAMMTGAQYGHVIKHLECSHLNSLPMPNIQAEKREHFNSAVKDILKKRDEAYALAKEAEAMFEESIGEISVSINPEIGFETSSKSLFEKRRRLEASYHITQVSAILEQFRWKNFTVEDLSSVTERVWWMTRFKRVFGDAGAPYYSAEDLFSINPGITKRVLIEQAENAEAFFVKAGWIVMACSGQTYGLLGSVALMTKYHESSFFSHDLIRIVPRREKIHSGYLFTVLGHPKLGRPLLLRYAYGTSIPHLEPSDVSGFPVVRLGERKERVIGERMEKAAALRFEADELENSITAEAEEIINRFMAGDSSNFIGEIGKAVDR